MSYIKQINYSLIFAKEKFHTKEKFQTANGPVYGFQVDTKVAVAPVIASEIKQLLVLFMAEIYI